MTGEERRLVFISAGDHHQIHQTLNVKDAAFDVVVSFYGTSVLARTELERRGISVYSARGSKFQNLKSLFNSNPRIFDPYDAVLVLDDDLSLNANEVTGLFDFRQQHDFWIVQPAFQWGSSLGDQYSRCNPLVRYRYTNFVEVNAPLFRVDKLEQFMRIYDGSLVGWGIDMWYLNLFEEGALRKFAICDEISTVNPFSRSGVGWREIDQLQSQDDRRRSWEKVKKERKLSDVVPRTYPGPRRDAADATLEATRLTLTLCRLALNDHEVRRSEWRYLKSAAKRVLRDLIAGTTARILRRSLRIRSAIETPLRLLASAWGNTACRPSEHFIKASMEISRRSEGPLLAFGADLTTLAMSAFVGSDRRVIALEQDAAWARRLKRRFLLGGVGSIELLVSSVGMEDAILQGKPDLSLPDWFAVVVVQPHVNDSSGWSNDIPDFLARRLDENTAILVDGVEEPKARMLANRWADRLDREVEINPKDSSVEKYASLVPHAIDHVSSHGYGSAETGSRS